MGFLPVLARMRLLLRRIRETAAAAVAARPDVLVIIDSPGFTHRVAQRVRQVIPDLPVVDYVSPSVWAWRPGRAPAMRAYVDHVLALLPFEPAAHARLGGPACTYVGHPLIERLFDLRPNPDERARREALPPRLVVLPGSRRSEIDRLMPVFGATLTALARGIGPVDAVLPAVSRHRARIERLAEGWTVKPRIVEGEAAKYRAFRTARAALAASGTVTLELALAGVPTVVAYKVSRGEEAVARRLIQVPTIVLPNLILGENAVPELIQADCTPARLVAALAPLLLSEPARKAQAEAMARLDALMALPDGVTPSEAAAQVVLAQLRPSASSKRRGRGRR
jgi:lipid-A-disaccharide synthase